ncbi:hypothetical protein Tco_1282193 [Tanacetum coccineum]
MAQLKYCDKHNQVGFLRKPDESAGFAEIVDFLRGSNLRYALSTNPTIYDSLVKQFWQTATANTIADGTLELHATIDTTEYTITEASIRDKLHLADASGITMLPNNEIFEGMGANGIFGNMKRGFRGVPRPLLPAMLSIIDLTTTIPPLSQPAPPTPIAETTTASPSPSPSPAHEPMEHTFEQQSTDQQPPTPRQEATTSQLMTKIELVTPSKTVNASGEEQVKDISPITLEAATILTKVHKIKSVDKGKRYKRRKSSKEFAGTGLDFEEVKSAFEKVNTCGIKVSSGIEEINAGSLDVNTGIDPVTTDSIRVSVPSPDIGRREGKAPMIEEEETQASRKTKEQIRQEEAGLAEAIRLDALEKALENEEVAKQFGFTYSSKDYWDTIRAMLEANAELKESVLGKDLTVEDYAKRMVELLTQLKKLNFEEVKAEFENLVKQLDTYVPMNFEATKESLKRFGEELQTKTAKKLKFDDEGTQSIEEKIEEYKDDKPTKKTGKRRKQIARKGLHTDHDRDESKDSDEVNEKDDSTSGRKGVYQIVRENGTDMVYISFGAMLNDISRDDLTELYRIVMKKHGMNKPEDEFEKVLWKYLKNMFKEPLSTDSI